VNDEKSKENISINEEFKGSTGFKEEGDNGEQDLKEHTRLENETKYNPSKFDELKRNFNAVFGHGIGKLSLVAITIFVISGIALGYRGLTSKSKEIISHPEVDMPNAPQLGVDIGAVSKQEAERRAQQAVIEAQQAAEQGQTYQPGFDTDINDDMISPLPPSMALLDGVNENELGLLSQDKVSSSMNDGTQRNIQIDQQARQRLEQELKQAQNDREKYVGSVKEQVLRQAQVLFGENGQGGLNSQGAYSVISYYPNTQQENGRLYNNKENNGISLDNPEKDINNNLLIKAGNIMYATLDSEVNTDDGNDVFATIRGGKWDGSKIIGSIEQSQNNIRLKFSVMAPQDDRPTMSINAVALREEDAKQGIAENINHHTLSRYTALATSSLMSGYGRAYSESTNSTTIVTPGGTVITSNTEPSNKQIIGRTIGEMGEMMSQEIRHGFNRPPTYSTPSQKGFGLFFVQDVYE